MEDGQSHRELFMDRALGLFSLRGYDAVGVQELCQAASLSKPSLYHYFGSKQGLLEAIIAERGQASLGIQAKGCRYKGDIFSDIFAAAKACLEAQRALPDFSRLSLGLYFAPPESPGHICCKPYHSSVHRLYEDFFLKAAADHGNMRGRESDIALSFQAMGNSLNGLELSGIRHLDDDDIRSFLKRFMHGIFS